MELFSSSDVQRHSILLNRRCRTAPVDNGKLRRPTRCRYDSLLNFLFITHEGPPLQIAALPGGRWPGATHLIPGKTKLKYLYLCIPCLQLVEKPGCTLRSNRVFGIFAEESVENQEMVLVVPPPCCQLFQVHGSKLTSTTRARPSWSGVAYRAVGRLVSVNQKVMLLFDFSQPEMWKAKKPEA